MNTLVKAMVLGDGSLHRTKTGAWLSLGHCAKQKSYLLWKRSLLESLGPRNLETYYKGDFVQYQIRWNSRPEWGEIYDQLYGSGHKRITGKDLDELDDLGWAIFFGDDGYLRRDDRLGFNASDRAIFYISEKICCGQGEIKEVLESRFGRTSIYESKLGILAFRLNAVATQVLGEITNSYLKDSLSSKVVRPRRTKRRAYQFQK